MIEKIGLLECEYFPCIAWYQNFLNFEKVQVEKHEFFERATLRNRCYLASSNGLIMLSIPLKGGRNQKTIMQDIRLSYDENWQKLHWKTIESCYRRSPYFEYYAQDIKQLFDKPFDFLFDFNVACIETINQLLQVKNKIDFTDVYQAEVLENMSDLRNVFTSENYHQYQSIDSYIQVFQTQNGFQSNLSILDMLFCVGKPLVKLLTL